MTVEVRRLREGEAEPLRELRLRALREAPRAFAPAFATERELPPEHWSAWAAAGAQGEAEVVVVAVDGERWVGMIACRLLDDRPGSTWLRSLWVDPSVRGTGLGARLIEAVADWSRAVGASSLELSVTANNGAAAALYARTGFAETGRRRPLPADPSRTEVFLARPL